jgi:hypothetical protein
MGSPPMHSRKAPRSGAVSSRWITIPPTPISPVGQTFLPAILAPLPFGPTRPSPIAPPPSPISSTIRLTINTIFCLTFSAPSGIRILESVPRTALVYSSLTIHPRSLFVGHAIACRVPLPHLYSDTPSPSSPFVALSLRRFVATSTLNSFTFHVLRFTAGWLPVCPRWLPVAPGRSPVVAGGPA